MPGRYLYGGPLKYHFGHIIADASARLYAYDPSIHQGVVFAGFMNDMRPPGLIQQIPSLFGAEWNENLVVKSPKIIETLDFAVPGMINGLGPTDWYLDLLSSKTHPIYENTPKDIFYGRTHIIRKGTLMGETYFSKKIVESGFVYVTPEDYASDLYKQLSYIHNASRIVFTEGSSIHAIDLLGKVRADVFMLPRRPNGSDMFSNHIKKRTSFKILGNEQDIIRLEGLNGTNSPSSPSYSLNPSLIMDDLVQLGLVKGCFDIKKFEDDERADAKSYWLNTDVATEQISRVRVMRSGMGVRSN